MALVTETLDRWRDGPVSVFVLWRAGTRILSFLVHRSGRMRAQYNTCAGNIAKAVADPPLTGHPAESRKKSRVVPARCSPLCQADQPIHFPALLTMRIHPLLPSPAVSADFLNPTTTAAGKSAVRGIRAEPGLAGR